MASDLKEHFVNRRNMLVKFIFVSIGLTVLVKLLLASVSSPRTEQVPLVGQKFLGLGCQKEKKQNDHLLGTIDALRSLVKQTNAEMENALLREREKSQELKNAILGHERKEYQLEQQKTNFEQKILYLDKKVEILLSNFTYCQNHLILVQKETLKLQSCETERETEKQFDAQSTNKIEEEKKLVEFHSENCTDLKDSLSRMLGAEKENRLRDKTTLIANLELCKEKQKMFNNYVLESFFRDSPYPGVENYTRYTVARLGMLPIKNAKPLIPEFGPVINDVLSFRYPINIPSCPNKISAKKSVFLAIISAASHFNKRTDIRKTWLSHVNILQQKRLFGMVRFGFFLGMTGDSSIQNQIEEESNKHGDIIQIDMDDTYRNLTLKGVGLLNWVRQHCTNVDIVFKVDDDVYVNMHNLFHFVQSNYQSTNSLFGQGMGETKPVREKDITKFYLSLEEYPWSNYPYNYLSGPAYFIHGSAIIPLLAASQTTPLFQFDHIFFTAMCTAKSVDSTKIRVSIGSNMVYQKFVPAVPTPCDVGRSIAWPSENQVNSHKPVDDFYGNLTRCVIEDSSGKKIILDHTSPVHFQFT